MSAGDGEGLGLPPERSWAELTGREAWEDGSHVPQGDQLAQARAEIARLEAHIDADHAAMVRYLAQHSQASVLLEDAADSLTAWRDHARLDCAALGRVWRLAQAWRADADEDGISLLKAAAAELEEAVLGQGGERARGAGKEKADPGPHDQPNGAHRDRPGAEGSVT